MRPTWTSPSRVDGPAWPCTGRGLPGRRVTTTPVRSYRTISPLPVRGSRVAAPSAVSFLWHFPAAFAGWALPTALPFGVRTFLEADFSPPRVRSARPIDVRARSSVRPDLGQAGRTGGDVVSRPAGRAAARAAAAGACGGRRRDAASPATARAGCGHGRDGRVCGRGAADAGGRAE